MGNWSVPGGGSPRAPARSSPSFLRLPAGRAPTKASGVRRRASGERDVVVTSGARRLNQHSAPTEGGGTSSMVVEAIDVQSRVKTVEMELAGRTLSLETGL